LNWVLEVGGTEHLPEVPAWQGTKEQSAERPQEQLIEEEELARSLMGPCVGVGGAGEEGLAS
jgi:hypothetical protein